MCAFCFVYRFSFAAATSRFRVFSFTGFHLHVAHLRFRDFAQFEDIVSFVAILVFCQFVLM